MHCKQVWAKWLRVHPALLLNTDFCCFHLPKYINCWFWLVNEFIQISFSHLLTARRAPPPRPLTFRTELVWFWCRGGNHSVSMLTCIQTIKHSNRAPALGTPSLVWAHVAHVLPLKTCPESYNSISQTSSWWVPTYVAEDFLVLRTLWWQVGATQQFPFSQQFPDQLCLDSLIAGIERIGSLSSWPLFCRERLCFISWVWRK